MLTFLRKIRRFLITSSLTRKPATPTIMPARPLGGYLLYAIGEIALVVLGILIALQINNWNEGRKEVLKEIEILTEIKQSFQTDLEVNISRPIRYFYRLDTVFYDLLSHLDQSLPYDDSLMPKFYVLTQGRHFNFNQTAYKNLETIGIDIISDNEVKTKISDIYNLGYVEIENSMINYDDNVHEYGRPIIRSHFFSATNADTRYTDNNLYEPNNYITLSEMPEYRNILIILKRSNLHHISILEYTKGKIEEAIELMDKYVDKLEND